MSTEFISFKTTGGLPPLIEDYIDHKSTLHPFITDFPTKENLLKKMKKASFDSSKRSTLVNALEQQYLASKMTIPKGVELLKKEESFTVTTGHQLNLYGGPKYFIHKIISIVKLARVLNKEQNTTTVVPVFWLASEDHDFEEINALHLFGKTLETDQIGKGPVGRLSPKIFAKTFEELQEIIGNSGTGKTLITIFEKAYERTSWAGFTRSWVQALFGEELVIIDGDDRELKQLFSPIIEDELVNRSSQGLIEKMSNDLLVLDYHKQLSPRPINLFYIEDGIRERIIEEGGLFKVLNTDFTFSNDEIREKLKSNPECFSPNASLRPVYQEFILPNVATIGGPGELSYWVQLKSNFDRLAIPFPILVLRDSFLLIKTNELELLSGMGLKLKDIFSSIEKLIEKFLQFTVEDPISFEAEKEALLLWQKRLSNSIDTIDPNLNKMIGSEFSNWNKLFDRLDAKIKKHYKNQGEIGLNRLKKLKRKIHPDGKLNERNDSFIGDFLQLENDYISTLIDVSDIFNPMVKVIIR